MCIAAVFMSGCGTSKETLNRPYVVFDVFGTNDEIHNSDEFFASDLCVTSNTNLGTEQTDSSLAQAACVFNLNRNEITYSQNIYERLYPASTTKILTAYIILKYCDVNELVTVSDNAANQASDSSVCGLNSGDVLTVSDLLHGLMIKSGNDAAVALAEHYSGTESAFAELMNQEALKLGATNSHFVNASGLPNEDHYTTVYDLYLIFNAALQNDTFVSIMSSRSYEASYHNKNDEVVVKTWNNTNKYLSGEKKMPQNTTVIGGKTGTTYDAGYCLALYSLNANNERIISIVFKSDSSYNLYLYMNEIISEFAN